MKNEDIYNSFFESLFLKKYVNLVEKIGLLDATINKTSTAIQSIFEFCIKDIFIFKKDCTLISNIRLCKPVQDSTITSMIAQLSSIINDLQPGMSSHEGISLTVMNLNGDEFVFLSLDDQMRIIFIVRASKTTNIYLIKLYALHMMTAFLNFIGDNSEIIANDIALEENKSNYFFQAKLFEQYFAVPLTRHFEKLIRCLFKKEEMYLSYIKFKNCYIVDLSRNEILCDLSKIRNNKKSKKIFKNEKIWQELLYHSHNLMDQYKLDNQMKYDNLSNQNNFVKVECTSTYPRLTFVIKFLPILYGVAMIHVYAQNKLSRSTDNEGLIQTKTYKEFDIIYGNEIIKSSNQIEFRYTEPKKLKELERFFSEFYLSTNASCELLFHDNKHELKYMECSVINYIDEVITKSKACSINTPELLLGKINARLYEAYMSLDVERMKSEKNNNGNVSNILITGMTNEYRKDLNNNQNNNLSCTDNNNNSFKKPRNKDSNNSDVANVNYNFLCITKEFILKELFENTQNPLIIFQPGSELGEKDNTLQLSKLDEPQEIPNNCNDNIFEDFINKFSEISRQPTFNYDYEENDRQSRFYEINSEFDPNITGIEKKQKKSAMISNENIHTRVKSEHQNNLMIPRPKGSQLPIKSGNVTSVKDSNHSGHISERNVSRSLSKLRQNMSNNLVSDEKKLMHVKSSSSNLPQHDYVDLPSRGKSVKEVRRFSNFKISNNHISKGKLLKVHSELIQGDSDSRMSNKQILIEIEKNTNHNGSPIIPLRNKKSASDKIVLNALNADQPGYFPSHSIDDFLSKKVN